MLDTARTSTPRSEEALEAAVAGRRRELADRHRDRRGRAGAGRVRHPRPAWRPVRAAPVVARRAGRRPHRGRGSGCRSWSSTTPTPPRSPSGTSAPPPARRRCVFIALGTGIGSALLLDGELYRGAFGVAPELGHMQVVPDGRPCPCGKTAAGSATAAAPRWRPPPSSCWPATGCARRCSAGWSRATPAGDRPARWPRRPARATPWPARRWRSWPAGWAEGLALVADVFDPELIVIGGGVSESAPLFLDEAREHYAARPHRRRPPPARPDPHAAARRGRGRRGRGAAGPRSTRLALRPGRRPGRRPSSEDGAVTGSSGSSS